MSSLRNRVDRKRELTLQDVERIVNKPIFLITADNKSNLPLLLENDDSGLKRVVIHYQNSDNGLVKGGHWCGMLIDNFHKNIYFFDPYGGFPDDQLNKIQMWYRKKTHQQGRDIGKFLADALTSGYKIFYNEHKLQKMQDGNNTCGRWVASFLKRGQSTDNFYKFISSYNRTWKDPTMDDSIVRLTNNILLQ